MFKNKNKDKKNVDDKKTKDEKEVKEDKVIVEEDKKTKKTKIYKEKKPLKEAINDNKAVQTFKLHKFIIKIVATVILIAFAIILFIYQDAAIFAVLLITGGVSVFGAVIRVFFAFNSKKTKGSKIMSGIELAIHFLFGLFLVIGAFIYKNAVNSEAYIQASTAANFNKNDYLKDNNFIAYFVQNYYPYFLAGILYIRGVAYFYHTVLGGQKTHKFTFWLHIACFTLAVVIAALASKIDTTKIVITLGVIACICALVIGGEAVVGYINFNNNNKKLNETKDETKEDDLLDSNILPEDDRAVDSINVN